MAEWDIKNKEHNEMFDMRDTVQTWPNESHQISFSIVSTPGKVEHSIWLSVEGSRDFANYLLRACDRVERIQEARKARRYEREVPVSFTTWKNTESEDTK